ncbi:hypothetical protein SAMN04488060_1679 [Qipengyuania nanhaisediminis]|uniref:Uncharacterized protein n=1 Tax=Qipengyuania nanhaisediminis TaxID=604088 RepID=A0A1I5MZF4_9SPHN|nr:hypothetical protein SAMN04488060_1679 [Qipengyuania nanhaisediminis]
MDQSYRDAHCGTSIERELRRECKLASHKPPQPICAEAPLPIDNVSNHSESGKCPPFHPGRSERGEDSPGHRRTTRPPIYGLNASEGLDQCHCGIKQGSHHRDTARSIGEVRPRRKCNGVMRSQVDVGGKAQPVPDRGQYELRSRGEPETVESHAPFEQFQPRTFRHVPQRFSSVAVRSIALERVMTDRNVLDSRDSIGQIRPMWPTVALEYQEQGIDGGRAIIRFVRPLPHTASQTPDPTPSMPLAKSSMTSRLLRRITSRLDDSTASRKYPARCLRRMPPPDFSRSSNDLQARPSMPISPRQSGHPC